MPGNSRRERELARRRYERQQVRRARQHQRRARMYRFGAAGLAAVLVLGGAAYGIYLAVSGGSSNSKSTVASKPSAAASVSPSPAACAYTPSAGGQKKNVGQPSAANLDKSTPYTMTIKTNRGTITAKLDTAQAPCTVNSFKFLASKNYFDNTKCHRLVTSGIFVLQCGDPSGTGTGGPGYQFPDENLGAFGKAGSGGQVIYPKGTIAMANAGPGTNGSQFFIVYKDSPLAPAYTPFGTVTSGLDVVQKVAAAGNASDGTAPKLPVTIEDLAVTPSGSVPTASESPTASPSP